MRPDEAEWVLTPLLFSPRERCPAAFPDVIEEIPVGVFRQPELPVAGKAGGAPLNQVQAFPKLQVADEVVLEAAVISEAPIQLGKGPLVAGAPAHHQSRQAAKPRLPTAKVAQYDAEIRPGGFSCSLSPDQIDPHIGFGVQACVPAARMKLDPRAEKGEVVGENLRQGASR